MYIIQRNQRNRKNINFFVGWIGPNTTGIASKPIDKRMKENIYKNIPNANESRSPDVAKRKLADAYTYFNLASLALINEISKNQYLPFRNT